MKGYVNSLASESRYSCVNDDMLDLFFNEGLNFGHSQTENLQIFNIKEDMPLSNEDEAQAELESKIKEQTDEYIKEYGKPYIVHWRQYPKILNQTHPSKPDQKIYGYEAKFSFRQKKEERTNTQDDNN